MLFDLAPLLSFKAFEVGPNRFSPLYIEVFEVDHAFEPMLTQIDHDLAFDVPDLARLLKQREVAKTIPFSLAGEASAKGLGADVAVFGHLISLYEFRSRSHFSNRSFQYS